MSPKSMMAASPEKKTSLRQNIKHLKRLNTFLAKHKLKITAIFILTGISVFLNVIGPWVMGKATNLIFDGLIGKMLPPGVSKSQAAAVLNQKGHSAMANILENSGAIPGVGIDFKKLGLVLLAALGLYLFAALFAWLSGVILRVVVQDVGWNLRREIQEKIDALPLSYLDSHPRGDLLSRVTNDVDNLIQTLLQSAQILISSVLTIIGIGVMMFLVSWKLTILALLVLPLGAIISAVLMKKAAPSFKEQWKQTGQVSSIVEDTFTGHTVMTSYNLADNLQLDFDQANDSLFKASSRAQFFSGLIQPAMVVASNFSYVVVAVVGALQMLSGTLNLGDVQAFIQYSRRFNEPVSQLASMSSQLQSGAASAERVFEFLDVEQMAPDSENALPSEVQAGRVVFEHVHFGYDPEKPVINDLNLAIEPGQTVAIVGPTGAGKTTLVNLIMRFYEINSGHIYLDGVDISTINKASLRTRFGMVLQDTWLFEGSIADNIAYGSQQRVEDISRQQVIEAAKATSVDHMIQALPEGYDTVLDESGEGISAGQKQLITIARAFMANPEVLILDEATSSVDTRTEVAVQEAMSRIRKGRTAFIIAHRLSTIRDADLIVVMEHGDVVETGTHKELLAKNGAYRRLYDAQFSQAS